MGLGSVQMRLSLSANANSVLDHTQSLAVYHQRVNRHDLMLTRHAA